MSESKLERFKSLLAELFMFDNADLDFGIYRIMNAKRDEITKFLDKDLLPQVREMLSQLHSSDRSGIEKQLAEAIKQANDLGIDPSSSPKVKELQTQLTASVDVTAIENEVFSHLYNFFRRYYKEGDILSLPRYKEGVYAIPYEGEEVKLHWANKDQYYIKSGEYFRDFTFIISKDRKVHFKLKNATIEQDNKKEITGQERKFILSDNDPLIEEDKELFIAFEYKEIENKKSQKVINEETIQKLFSLLPKEWKIELSELKPSQSDPKRTVLQKYLYEYTARNTFDYFIHKNLGNFLNRELDFYIKNDVMHLDDIESEATLKVDQYLLKIKAIRKIACKIIAFLTQLENYQKMLWKKKKFVIETNYCLTINKISPTIYQDLLNSQKQIQEWIREYQIDKVESDFGRTGFTNPLTEQFLIENQYLTIDTANYSEIEKNKIIGSISNLDDNIDGILIKSENYQGLNLLNNRFKGKIDCIYIDPPFNLGENPDYLYKVDYKDSSWLTLLENRINLAKEVMSKSSSIFVRCSHDGNMYVRLLLEHLFGSSNYRNEIIVRRAELSKGDLNKQFGSIKTVTVNYDNIYWYSKNSDVRFGRILKPTSEEQSLSHWHSFWKAEDRPNLRYDILGIDLRNHYGQWMWKKTRADIAVENYIKYQEIYASTGESLDDYWKRTGEVLEFVKRDGDGYSAIKYWIPPRTFVMADNNWLDIRGYANKWGFKTENSEPLLKRIIESLTQEKQYVLDFFLGSGTTAATAHKLGRKWIGIEMGDHFDTILINRLKNVLYGDESGISKDVDWKGGGMFKYMILESYEDTLNNISMIKTIEQSDLLDKHSDLREEYILKYNLNIESKNSSSILNTDKFKNPFNYTLNIASGAVGDTKQKKVDLVETFNYLLGLEINHIDNIKDYKIIDGVNPQGEKVLIIWRNTLEKTNEALDDFFQKQGYNTRDKEYDVIYVNGDNNLENLRRDDETWKVRLIEEEFHRLMFEDVEGQ